MSPVRPCSALLLLSLLCPHAVRAQEPVPTAATEPAVPSDVRLFSQVGGGLLGALAGGLLGTGAGVVMDLHRCILWCDSQPSHVPRAALVGAGVGGLSGVLVATWLTQAPAPSAPQGARLELIHFDPRARSIGLSGRF